VAPDVDIELMAQATHGFSGADISEICQRAAKNAIRESINYELEKAAKIEAGELDPPVEGEEEYDPVPFITKAHFEEAMSRARRSVSEADLRKYETYNQQQKAARGFGEFKFDGDEEKGSAQGEEEEDVYS